VDERALHAWDESDGPGEMYRSVYLKLGVHRRADAVTRAGEIGLLSPTSLRR